MSSEPLLSESSPLPKLHEFMPAVLSYLSDGSVRTSKEIRSAVAKALGLSPRQLAAKLPSGRLVYADRTYWAYKYLEQWGAVKSPHHVHFVITDKGRALMAQYPHGVPAEVTLEITRAGRARHKQPKGSASTDINLVDNVPAELSSSTPEELINVNVAQLEAALAQDILERVRVLSPSAFEQLVVDVLLADGLRR